MSSRPCPTSALLHHQPKLLQLNRTARTFVLASHSVPDVMLRDSLCFQQPSRFHRPEHDKSCSGFLLTARCIGTQGPSKLLNPLQPEFRRQIQPIQNRRSGLRDRATFAGLQRATCPVQQLQVFRQRHEYATAIGSSTRRRLLANLFSLRLKFDRSQPIPCTLQSPIHRAAQSP